MRAEMSPAAVKARLQLVGRCSSLKREQGVSAKAGDEAWQVTARLKQVSRLRELCRRLEAIGRQSFGEQPRPSRDEVR